MKILNLRHPGQRSITDLDLWHLNRSRSTKGHHYNKLGRVRVLNAAYRVSRSSAIPFLRRRFSKIFTIYGHSGHLGHGTKTL